MSPRRCAVDGCKSISGQQQHQGVKFHTFPINLATRKIWIDNCRIARSRNITKSVLVCSRHFRRADFLPLKNNKHFLKNGAVPTIFPWGNLPYHEVSGNAPTNSNIKIRSTESSRLDKETLDSKAMSGSTSDATKKQSVRQKSLSSVDASVKHRSASAEEKNNENRSMADKLNTRKSLDSATISAIQEEKVTQSIESAKPAGGSSIELIASLVSGAKLEAQDFSGSWHNANVVEVDHGEQEVLINFEKTSESKGPPLIDEWISMNSNRLRPIEKQKPTPQQFSEGERCLARWTDSRKFPATVQKVLDNNMFEVLFDDGYPKTVKASHMSKLKRNISEKIAPVTPIPVVKKPMKTTQPIPKFDLSRFNLPEIPMDGEWCCPWVNDTPIGQEGFLTNADGNKRPTVLVEDWRLPKEWTKHLYQRSSVSGKWDVVLVGPNNKRFRSKNDVKVYLEGHGQSYNPDVYDFSIHKRRAKDIGVYVYTDDYVPPVVPKPNTEFKRETSFASPSPNVQQLDLFPGFSPEQSTTSVETLNATKEILSSTPTTAYVQEHPLEAGYIYVGALKVQIIDNLFRCPKEGCNKNFRKENHLQIHVKHYHDELSKQLGACPNMTDLAYFRTMGTAIDETPSKNHIANTQYFEKAYQPITPTKALPTPSTDLVHEIIPKEEMQHSPIMVETLKRKSTELHSIDVDEKRRSTDLNNVSAIEVDPIDLPMSSAPSPIEKQETVPVAPVVEKVVPSKAPVHRFKIGKLAKGGKAGRKKGGKNFRYRKMNRRMKKQYSDALASNAANESLEFTETQSLFVGAEKTTERGVVARPKYNRQKFRQYSLFKDARLDKGGSVIATTMPRYINENGKMIKIVRMRQEEIINCLCSYGEEDGLMIQCELCLCWQHGGCNGIEKESEVPEKYVCYICRNPIRGRESMKYIHDQDWLYDGKLYQAMYHEPNTALSRNSELLKQSHTLTGNLLDLKRSLHSLNVKINIAANKDHPKLYLWSKKWENDSRKVKGQSLVKRDDVSDTIKVPSADDRFKTNENNDPNQLSSETRIADKTEDGHMPSVTRKEIEEDNSILSNLLSSPETNKNSNSNTFDGRCSATINSLPKQDKCPAIESKPDFPNIPEPEAAINPLDCQRNLLEHIQREQSTILSRMKTIDAQIIALEMDNHQDTYSDPDFLKTNQTIHMLLNDICKLRKMIDISQTATVNSVE